MKKKSSLFLVSGFLFLVSGFLLPSAFALDCPSGYKPEPNGAAYCYRLRPPEGCLSTEIDAQDDLDGKPPPENVCLVNAKGVNIPQVPLPGSEVESHGFSALGLPALVISTLLDIVIPIIGFITIIMIIISGIQFITSRGDPKAAEGARGRLTYAIIGFVITVLAFALTQIISKLFLNINP